MMNKIGSVLLMLASLIFLSGWERPTDPRKGGLFGYNPKAYEKRQKERREKAKSLEDQQAEEKGKSKKLEEDVALKSAERDDLAKMISLLDSDIAKVEEEILNAKFQTEEQKDAQWKLNMKLKGLKKKLGAAKSPSAPDTKAKAEEVERLKKELDSLLEEAEALSTL